MDKNGVINLKDWQDGMAESPFVGFGRFQNVDGFTEPGVLQQTFNLQDISGDLDQTPIYSRVDPATGNVFVQTDSGKIHKSTSGGNFTLISGNTAGATYGMEIWNGWLFSFRANGVDIYDISNNVWSNSWTGFSGHIQNVTNHYTFVGKDNVLYYCNGRYIGRLIEVGTFDPTNASTYTNTGTFLDTKDDYAKTAVISELNNYLVFGVNYTGSLGYADLFYWDRTSSSSLLTGKVTIQENNITQILSMNGVIYLNTGTRLYQTVLSQTGKLHELKQMRLSTGFLTSSVTARAGAITNWNNGILWSVCTQSTVPSGLYYSKDKKLYFYTFDNTTEDGSSGNALDIGFVMAVGTSFYVGGRKASTYKIYKTNYGLAQSSDASFVESGMYITSGESPKTFQFFEFFLSEPMSTSSDSVKLQYRTQKNASWTTFGTYSYTNLGAIDYHRVPFGVQARQIQFRIIINGQVKLRHATIS